VDGGAAPGSGGQNGVGGSILLSIFCNNLHASGGGYGQEEEVVLEQEIRRWRWWSTSWCCYRRIRKYSHQQVHLKEIMLVEMEHLVLRIWMQVEEAEAALQL
jgi:hypothetical protein